MIWITIWIIGAMFTLGFEAAQHKRKDDCMVTTDVWWIIAAWPAVLGGIIEFYLNEDKS